MHMLFDGYLVGGYLDEHGHPRRELYVDWAERVAKKLLAGNMTITSLRRYYQHIKAIEEPLIKDFANKRHPLLTKIFPYGRYGYGKKDSNVAKEFIVFLEQNLPFAERDVQHFRLFVDHFQSVVGHFVYFDKENQQELRGSKPKNTFSGKERKK